MRDLWRSYQFVALQHHDICRPAGACSLAMLGQHGQADVCCSVGAWTLSVRDQSSTSCSGAHAAHPLRDADRERARRTGGCPRAQAALDAVEQERRAVARAGAGAEAQAGVRGSADDGPGQAPGQGAAPSAGPTGRLMLDLTHAGAATAPAPGRRPNLDRYCTCSPVLGVGLSMFCWQTVHRQPYRVFGLRRLAKRMQHRSCCARRTARAQRPARQACY